MPDFDIIGAGISGAQPSGLLMGLDPAYQTKQADAAVAQLALKRATAFQNGVPTNPDGSLDIDTLAKTQIQNGDVSGGLGLLTTGMKLALLRDPSTVSNPTGQGGGLSSGLIGAQPAAGGGMIAPAAGGDSYGRQPTSGQAGAGGATSGGSQALNPDVVGYIRTAAAARGIDPNVALRVAASEGLKGFDPNGNANLGDDGSSAGPFQLHYGGVAGGGNAVAGLGDDFTKATGLDARDPSTWKQQTDFALDHAVQSGWGAFHGAKASNIGNWTGIGSAGQAGAGPQAAAAPSGASAQPISFGGPAASAPTPGASSDGTAGVSDDLYATAKRVVAHFQGTDPRTMTLDEQHAVARAKELIGQRDAAQGGDASPGTADGAPAAAAVAPTTGAHPFAPGGGGRNSPAAPGAQPVAAAGQAGGGQPISFGGVGAPAVEAAAPQAGGAPAAPLGGAQPISFGGGGPQAAPAAGGAPAAPGAMPPRVAAALTRLQNRQGSPADAQLWGSYLRSVGPGVAGAVGGPQGAGSPAGAPAAVLTPPARPASTGPDLPYLQGKYAAPGGGAQYVADLLDKARTYGLAGEQQASQAFIERAKQVQTDLAAVNKANLDLSTHNAELGDQQKLYRDAQGQGFQGTYLDFQNALATGKANAREDARLRADTDPSRISFAGAQAAATAAGTAQGAAPYKFVPTQPTPGGPTVYTSEADLANGGGGVKEQPAVFGQKQEALGKLDGEMQGQFQQRQVAHERLDAMSNLLETFQSGAGADAKAAAVAALRAAGVNIPDSATANPAAVEQFSKNATANVFQNAKDMGGRVLVSELDGLQKANANPNMQPGSNAAILAQQKGLLNYEDQRYQDYSAWRQQNPYATDASSFETAWAKAHPVGAYVAAAKKDIAPLGVPLPPQNQLSDGQAYIVKGQKVRWDADSSSFVPFTGTTAPVLPGQGSQGGGQSQGQGQGRQPPQASPPVAGARQAPDGNWYVPDPNRAGKFLMVAR